MFLLKKRPLRSTERILRNNRRLFYLAFACVCAVVALLSLAVWGSRREEVTISKITIIGTASVSEKELRAFAEQTLSGAYLWLFPRRNSFLYPKDTVKRGLFENFPRIASVAVSRASLRELSITVEERVPAYLWCGEESESRGAPSSGCYFLDQHGVVFAEAPYFSGSVYFEMYGALSAENVFAENRNESPLGFLFLVAADWDRVIALKDSLWAEGIPPEKFVLSKEGDAEFIFHNNTRLIFTMQGNLETALHNLLAALGAPPLSKETFTAQEKAFEYVDARFENRIFYK